MDRARFDAIAKVLATTGSRRAAFGALIGAGLFGRSEDLLAKKKGNGKGRGKGGDNGKGRNKRKTNRGYGSDAPQTDDATTNLDVEAVSETDDASAPVQAEAAGKRRGGGKSKGRGKGKGKSRSKSNSGSTNEQQAATGDESTRAAGGCCGKKSCSPPALRSDRGYCNLSGQNFAGTNAEGSNLWHSNSTGATFSTDARPSNFSRVNFKFACLGGAVFRKADIRFSDLQGTCLVDADLTGAVTNTSTNFWNAIFCRTRMPDGSINNSGCGKGTNCCPTCDARNPCPAGQVCCNGKCVTGDCCGNTDCKDPNKPICRGNVCSPCTGNAQCPSGVCCNGVCCAKGLICNAGICQEGCENDGQCGQGQKCCNKQCVAGNCCGVNDCANQVCRTKACDKNTCAYTVQPNGQPGTDCATQCCNGNCCAGSEVCFSNACCLPQPKDKTCEGKCGTVTNNCGQQVNCGDCPVKTCETATCSGQSTCNYTPVNDGQQGPNCTGQGQFCCARKCCSSGQVCFNDGCCVPQSKEQTCKDKCGEVINNCGQKVDCGPCAPMTCKEGTCGKHNICSYQNQANGQPGTNCPNPQFCCAGNCCDSNAVCFNNGCCIPRTKEQTCDGKCGNVVNNCGQTVDCGACTVQTCKEGTCNAQTNICEYTNQTNGRPGNNCPHPRQCCQGTCCTTGQVCFNNGCCTPISICPANACGSISDGCGGTVNCGTCPEVTCNTSACTNTHCVNTQQPNNQPGTKCASPKFCCGGNCCASDKVCFNNGCCIPDTKQQTCNGKCGEVVNNCGQKVDCGACAIVTCKSGSCDANICVYTNQTNGQPGNNCSSPRQCCNGTCCTSGQVCNNNACCTPDCSGKVCGSNGCGGTCGACPENSTCNAQGTACDCAHGFKKCGNVCIANDRCCTNNTPDTCPGGKKCCNGTCVAESECCPACGDGKTCCNGTCLTTCVTAPTPREERFGGGGPAPGCFRLEDSTLPVGGCKEVEGACGCKIKVCTTKSEGEPKKFSFSPVDGKKACSIGSVTVKGGTNQLVYTFNPPALCSSDMGAPENKGISHVDVCPSSCCS
mgnify:CR=1 FL=1